MEAGNYGIERMGVYIYFGDMGWGGAQRVELNYLNL